MFAPSKLRDARITPSVDRGNSHEHHHSKHTCTLYTTAAVLYLLVVVCHNHEVILGFCEVGIASVYLTLACLYRRYMNALRGEHSPATDEPKHSATIKRRMPEAYRRPPKQDRHKV